MSWIEIVLGIIVVIGTYLLFKDTDYSHPTKKMKFYRWITIIGLSFSVIVLLINISVKVLSVC